MVKKLKIGWFLTAYGALGGVRSVIETGNSLIREGHDFYVLGNVGSGKSPFCSDIIPIENHIPFNLYGDDSVQINNQNMLKNLFEFDILFNQDPVTMWLSDYVNAKIKVIHYCAGTGECYEKYRDIDAVRTSCSKLLFNVSQKHDADNLYKKYFIGQGINFQEFYPMSYQDSMYRKARDNKKINVLCCGSRGGQRKSNKGTYDIIEASLLLDPDKYNFIYFDLTRQDFPDNFRCIQTIGHQNTLSNVYAVADIYVAPDYVSAWNCCAGEAMACKKPVICSTQGIQDFGKDGENCLIYNENLENSPALLAEKIELLSNNDDLRKTIEQNGYENIKNFTWNNVSDRIVDIANKLL